MATLILFTKKKEKQSVYVIEAENNTLMMVQRQKLKYSKVFEFFQQSRWQEIAVFLSDTSEGRETTKMYGPDIFYAAIAHRAPLGVIISIFELLEKENGSALKLEPSLLLKALYLNTNIESKFGEYGNTKQWGKSDRIDIANFLSSKIKAQKN